MSSQSEEPLAPKTDSSTSKGKGKGKSTAHKNKTNSPPPTSKPKEHAPRSLDRLFAVDTSRALNVTLPSRYDPYYRFQDKPPVYAPYNSDILEEMARCGATSYSLALSEDSRCWRLNELMRDGELMKEFMAKPKGWTVRLGPRGQEVEYNVEDIVAAHLGTRPNYSQSPDDHPIPDPCNTPRPSTPYAARERDFLRATLSWGGMYEDLEEREEAEARAKAKVARSRASSSASSSSAAGPSMSRSMSLDTALSTKGKKESKVVWKTAYEDALSMEELGRRLDEEAAEGRDRVQDDSDSDSEEEEDGYGSSLFKRHTCDSDDEEEIDEPEMPRNAVYRAWNDPASDEGEGPVDKLNALFRRGDEEDSDDDISEGDIEPDPESPQDLFPSCAEYLSDEEDPEKEDEEGNVEKLEEQEMGYEDVNDGKAEETAAVMEQSKGIEKEREKVEPAPYVRPTAKSFLGMFFVRAQGTLTEDGDQADRNDIRPIPGGLAKQQLDEGGQQATTVLALPHIPSSSGSLIAQTSASTAKPSGQTGSGESGTESGDESEDYDTPATSMEHIELSDKGSDEGGHEEDNVLVVIQGSGIDDDAIIVEDSDDDDVTRVRLHPLFRRMADEDNDEDDAGPISAGGRFDIDTNEDQAHKAALGQGKHTGVCLQGPDEVNAAGVQGHKDEDEDDEDETEKNANRKKGKRDDHDDDHDETARPGGHDHGDDNHTDDNYDNEDTNENSDDKSDHAAHNGDQETSHEDTFDPKSGPESEEYGPDWDIHLSDEYKRANPNGNYRARLGYVNPTADWDMWRHDDLPDEWTEAVEWYQGGPEPDPSSVEWCCPLSRNPRYPLFVTQYTQPTEYKHHTQEEADATFCNGSMNYEGHARWLEQKLTELEKFRHWEKKYDFMINWRVRTGQQLPLCGGWWFMWRGREWWAID